MSQSAIKNFLRSVLPMLFRSALLVGLFIDALHTFAFAAITATGDVLPTDLSTWAQASEVYIGRTSVGELTVDEGSLLSWTTYIGYGPDSEGTVTIDGNNSTWTINGFVYFGWEGSGNVYVRNGGNVDCGCGLDIGASAGKTATVSVDGPGSKLTVKNYYSDLYVGGSGTATLNISNNGAVEVGGTTYVSYAGGTAAINFGPSGGTLTTGSLAAPSSQLFGSGTINTRGLITDDNLVLDSPSSLKQTRVLKDLPNQNITINLDLSGGIGTNGMLGAGYGENGSLTIKNGMTVASYRGCIGCQTGSTGVATVEGDGSCWNAEIINVGLSGYGILNVNDGGTVLSNGGVQIGENLGTGVVNVRGVGSTLTAGFNGLCIGDQGNGVLNIASGGVVNTSGSNNGIWETCLARLNGSAVARVDGAGSKLVSGTRLFIGGNGYANGGTGSVFITGGGNVTAVGMVAYAGSLLSIDVGRNSSLIVGSGTGSIANDGVIRILAGAGVPSDATQYSPISAGSWNGVCQAIGGTWDAAIRKFTASTVVSGISGLGVD